MSPRTGRPKSEAPKDFSLKVRFEKSDYECLAAYAESNGLSKGEVLRIALREFLANK